MQSVCFCQAKRSETKDCFFLFVCLCECANVSIFDSQSSGKWIAANRVRCFLNKSDLCARNHYTTTATLCNRQTICLAKFKSSVARTFEWQLRVFHTLFPSLSRSSSSNHSTVFRWRRAYKRGITWLQRQTAFFAVCAISRYVTAKYLHFTSVGFAEQQLYIYYRNQSCI